MNTQDYKWITQGRDVIMAQCAQLSEAQLAQSHGFALDSVKDTLLHITKCYRNWIGSFLLGNDSIEDFPVEIVEKMTLADIQEVYVLVDKYVALALQTFEDSMDVMTSSASDFKPTVQKTPHHLLLHAFTHECHHQGQITAMLSLMGHTPNNTNIVLFFDINRNCITNITFIPSC